MHVKTRAENNPDCILEAEFVLVEITSFFYYLLQGSSIKYVRKISRKTNICNPYVSEG